MATGRPLSPHLGTYRWGPAMAVSILHRATGSALAMAGSLLFLWWLGAIAGGAASYQSFVETVWRASPDAPLSISNWIGRIILVGLTWSFFQHFFSGLRHLVLDTGAGYDLKTNRLWAVVVMVAAVFVTAGVWLAILARGLA